MKVINLELRPESMLRIKEVTLVVLVDPEPK